MREIGSNIDENRLWQICFPNLFASCGKEGIYVVRKEEELNDSICLNGPGRSKTERAFSRLDMAITYIWPYVADLFIVDYFPHRLAAATDLLRAADFGEVKDLRLAALAKELASALDALEKVLAAENAAAAEGIKAAEETR